MTQWKSDDCIVPLSLEDQSSDVNRRSQKTSKNWSEFFTYLDRHPVAGPVKLKDLIGAT